jgi:hypothetical protein
MHWSGGLVIDYHPPNRHRVRTLMSGERTEYALNVSTELARELLRQAHAPFADGWGHDWVTVHVKLHVEGPDGDPKEFESDVKLG